MKGVLREGLNWRALTQEGVAPKREIGVGEIKQRYHKGDHPRTILTLFKEIKREGIRG
jgi:hypothetical protein